MSFRNAWVAIFAVTCLVGTCRVVADETPAKRDVVTMSVDHPSDEKVKLSVKIDVTDAPDLREWALKAGDYALRCYPKIEKELASPDYTPPRNFTIVFKEMDGVAHAAGDVIVVAAKWPREHPEDLGMVAHELVHVIQRYRGRRNPGWLVEGVADYVRYYVIEPGSKMGQFDPERSDYKRGYQPTAGLLDFIERTKGPGVVSKLNRAMREGKFGPDTFKSIAGAEPDELWEQFKAERKKSASRE